jgi:hypothetical protein
VVDQTRHAGALILLRTLRVTHTEDLGAALSTAGVRRGRPVVVVIGSANRMSDEELERARPWFDDGLVPAVTATGAAVVDGGTDAGVMRLSGWSRRSAPEDFDVIGVTAEGTVAASSEAAAPGQAVLEPNHTVSVLVPGSSWGDESPWITRVAVAVAAGEPVVGMLVKGGHIAERDATFVLDAGLPLLVIPAWGGAAEAFASLNAEGDGRASVVVVDEDEGPAGLRRHLEGALAGEA